MNDPIDLIVNSVLEQVGNGMLDDLRQTLADDYPPASAPGESPHRRSGYLQEGVSWGVERSGPIYTLTVASTALYSVYLEFGTSRMAARPFMSPALARWAPVLVARLDFAFSGSSGVFAAAA